MKLVYICFLSTYIIALFFNIQAIFARPQCVSTTTKTTTITHRPRHTITTTRKVTTTSATVKTKTVSYTITNACKKNIPTLPPQVKVKSPPTPTTKAATVAKATAATVAKAKVATVAKVHHVYAKTATSGKIIRIKTVTKKTTIHRYKTVKTIRHIHIKHIKTGPQVISSSSKTSVKITKISGGNYGRY